MRACICPMADRHFVFSLALMKLLNPVAEYRCGVLSAAYCP
jgi:hypothetical protein